MDADFSLDISLADRRDALRQPVAVGPVVIEYETLGSHPGTLADISRTGAQIICGCCFPCGGYVTITPPQESGLGPSVMQIMRRKLRENEETGEKTYEYGLRFADNVDIGRHLWFLTLRKAA